MAGYRILIADDDPVQRAVLGEYLSLSGYGVLEAEDGAQAIDVMAQEQPDLVLLDVHMPVMDGFSALAEIRRRSELKDIPVMLVTQLSGSHHKVKGLELGAEDYIVKPFNQAELLARVRSGLRRSRRYRRWEGALQGELGEVGLDDLLSTLQIGLKTAVVRLVDTDGEIHLHRGEVRHCCVRSFTGDAAFTRLLLCASGRFVVDFSSEPAGDGQAPARGLVAALICLDEVRRTLSELLAGDPILQIGAWEDDRWPELAQARPLSPLPLWELMVLLPGELTRNATIIAEAYQAGAITVSEPELEPSTSTEEGRS